jgi:hypothetical protein
MEIIRRRWKWRAGLVVLLLGSWLWYESNEADKRKAVEEAEIQAKVAENKKREEALFEKYSSIKKREKCEIKFEVTLETYGANVKVELRVGELGNSFPLVIKEASGGKLNYAGLCEGKYFIAIGNDKDVSTTPIQEFKNGVNYKSTVTLTKGVGNMGSTRREKL